MEKKKSVNPYIVIACGGGGSRMFPVKPKQFFPFIKNDETLLQGTFLRVSACARREHIFASTVNSGFYIKQITAQLPQLPVNNIIAEPCRRDTLPAIAFVAHTLYKRDKEAVVMIAPSDHAIKNFFDFVQAVQTAFGVVERHPEKIGLLGIEPNCPDTSLGYIRSGKEILDFRHPVFEVEDFKEKPDAKTARVYCNDETYLWNGGYFIFKAKTVLELIKERAPHVIEVLDELQAIEDDEERKRIFTTLSEESFDKVILEKIDVSQRFVVPAPLDWSDLGTWQSVYNYLPKDDNDNVCRGNVVLVDVTKSLVWSTGGEEITVFGLDGVGMVKHNGQVITFKLDRSFDMKKVVAALKR